MAHPLHELIGIEFEKYFNSKAKYKLFLDPACVAEDMVKKVVDPQNISFFLDKTKPKRAVWFTNVDIMVADVSNKTNKIKIVCEIDESNVKPGHIFGKFLSLISSGLCILNDDSEYYFDKELIFIQVLSNEKFKSKKHSKKVQQWSNIENAIKKNFNSFSGFRSISYHQLIGDERDFDKKGLITILDKL